MKHEPTEPLVLDRKVSNTPNHETRIFLAIAVALDLAILAFGLFLR